MILPDHQIKDWALGGGLSPFTPEHVNPASVDLTVAWHYAVQHGDNGWLGQTADHILVIPGKAILATTIEYIKMPKWAAGVIYLKSSMARMGLDHSLAGFVDPGFEGELTMELHAHRPLVLHAGQRVVQLVLYRMSAMPDRAYNGRYQGQRGPTPRRDP
jgi:dCTP deaminase